MDNPIVFYVILGLFLVLTIAMIVATRRYRQQLVPNYRALFVLGIAFVPLGLTTENWSMSLLGVVFMIVGAVNRAKWGQQTRWSDYPPELRTMKMVFATILVVLLLATLAFVLFTRSP